MRLARCAAIWPKSIGTEVPPTKAECVGTEVRPAKAFSAGRLSRACWRRLPACAVLRRRNRRRCAHRN
ncbi:DUF6053 domain-containing protein [Lysobacter enzymogenes]|uniref:DUF6053 domain-containing protein n=1 Tax=Lysobacter enzymogenes TaxID=69 RepID=UPI003D18BBA3